MYGTPDFDSVTISGDSDLREIKQRVGVGKNEELRQSEKRRRYLQKFARLMTRNRPHLSLSQSVPTAKVRQKDEGSHITITSSEFDQVVTSLPQNVFDLIMQEALCVHELGHIFYTDHEDFKDHIGDIDMERKSMFKKVWNTLEDGAIERQLRNRYAVADEILVLNANLFDKEGFGHIVDDETVSFSVFQAVTLGLSDMAVYDSGKFKRLMDPNEDAIALANDHDHELVKGHLPEMKKVVKNVLTTPDSATRNQHIRDYFETLEDLLDESEVSGQNQANLERLLGGDGSISMSNDDSDGDGDDEGDDEGDDTQAQPVAGKPDDTENDYGNETCQSAADLGMMNNAQEVDEQVEMAAGDMDPEDADAEPNTLGSGPTEDGDEGDDDADSDGEGEGDEGEEYDPSAEHGMNVSHELEDAVQEELAHEAHELDGGQATLDEVEQFHQILQQAQNASGNDDDSNASSASYEGFSGLTVDVPDMTEYDADRWQTAVSEGNKLAKILRNRLQRERASVIKHGQRGGRLDRRRMMLSERGSTRIFEREEENDEKDYDVIIVVDRSGSMSGNAINNAEIAAGSVALACEKVGIDTCILGMYNNEAQLTKPFGVDTDKKKENIVRAGQNQTSGGTPLSDTVFLARQRVQQNSDKNPFMVVITDGAPGRPEKYREQLDACTFPVLGIYMTNQRHVNNGHHDKDDALFHRITYVTSGNELSSSLNNLIQEIMF